MLTIVFVAIKKPFKNKHDRKLRIVSKISIIDKANNYTSVFRRLQ